MHSLWSKGLLAILITGLCNCYRVGIWIWRRGIWVCICVCVCVCESKTGIYILWELVCVYHQTYTFTKQTLFVNMYHVSFSLQTSSGCPGLPSSLVFFSSQRCSTVPALQLPSLRPSPTLTYTTHSLASEFKVRDTSTHLSTLLPVHLNLSQN